jgi:hypothetical protein
MKTIEIVYRSVSTTRSETTGEYIIHYINTIVYTYWQNRSAQVYVNFTNVEASYHL